MSVLETMDTPVGKYAPDFELPGIDNQVHHLRRYLERFRAVGVISMCNRCPYVEFYIDKLKQLQAEFGPQGFTLIGVNGNIAQNDPKESFDNMKAFARLNQLNFPYLWDSTQDVTRSFGATNTPMAFLIDQDGIVRYKGQVDSTAQQPGSAEKAYLKNAVVALLKQQEIRVAETEALGSSLVWRN
ncbi:thioredoxin family protein [Plectonema cf. radiosum LEGE 06105]|uniref:Thioredoxin family protein n=1 Tax=Plectonema cf. radiosum LEGE 06105 TaxID=945769 RepID=A0A8J7JRG2_9CYAN|nr:thioredoxin family protein [Plectonema radiosum]MBE9211304.1 thioredoxin family protein [Plectonema cf. radiosum LEGE 06105]